MQPAMCDHEDRKFSTGVVNMIETMSSGVISFSVWFCLALILDTGFASLWCFDDMEPIEE